MTLSAWLAALSSMQLGVIESTGNMLHARRGHQPLCRYNERHLPGQCFCETGYMGVMDCYIMCDHIPASRYTSCGGCISDAQCGWCEQTGNCSLLVVPFCPSALASNCKKKAESLINRTEFRAGAYALGALLLIFLAIVLIYKIFIWRRDKYLWEMYNKSKGDFLQTSPIYQPENTEMVSPLYEGTSGTTTAATQQSGFF